MKNSRLAELVRRAIAAAAPSDAAAVEQLIDQISKMGMDEIEDLTRIDVEILQIEGSYCAGPLENIRLPAFDDVVEAIPGRMTDDEFAKVLSGGTRQEWGPWRQLAEKVMARRQPK